VIRPREQTLARWGQRCFHPSLIHPATPLWFLTRNRKASAAAWATTLLPEHLNSMQVYLRVQMRVQMQRYRGLQQLRCPLQVSPVAPVPKGLLLQPLVAEFPPKEKRAGARRAPQRPPGEAVDRPRARGEPRTARRPASWGSTPQGTVARRRQVLYVQLGPPSVSPVLARQVWAIAKPRQVVLGLDLAT